MPKTDSDASGRFPTGAEPDVPALSLGEWADRVLSPIGLSRAAHHNFLIAELEAISRGDADRLMVLMPPGSAKSTYASVLFPAWWFARHPSSSVIAASHTADLASYFGRQVRNLISEHSTDLGYGLANDNRAAARWQTTRRGTYFAAGVRGPITGRRADLVIIDDPVKSNAEADSATFRDNVWNWYRADLVTRLKPGGRVVLIMTRWHEDDLGGRLLAQTKASGASSAFRHWPRRMTRWDAKSGIRSGPNGKMPRRFPGNARWWGIASGPPCFNRVQGPPEAASSGSRTSKYSKSCLRIRERRFAPGIWLLRRSMAAMTPTGLSGSSYSETPSAGSPYLTSFVSGEVPA